MTQEIKYNGFSATPSDYECQDGELALSLNMVQEDGSLKPLPQPASLLQLDSTQRVCYLHSGNGFTNLIIETNVTDQPLSYSWRKKDGDATTEATTLITLDSDETLTDINSVGNMLVISTSLHLHYIVYKDGSYTDLGTQVPDVRMSFALDAECISKEHTAKLSLSDYASAEDSYTNHGTATVDSTQVIAKVTGDTAENDRTLYKLNITQSLTKNTEYRFEPTENTIKKIKSAAGMFIKIGSDLTWVRCDQYIFIYGKKSDNTYVELAQWDGSWKNFTLTFRLAEEYTDYYIASYYTYWDKLQKKNIKHWQTSSDFLPAFEYTVKKGFSANVDFKMVTYNSDNYNALLAAINKFTNTYGTRQNRFVYPFFVRYAIKLADGTYARISCPVLMIPNSGYAPFVKYTPSGDSCEKVNLYAFFAKLQYVFRSALPALWQDYIAGVDIFVSQPVYGYKQGEAFDASEQLLDYAYITTATDETTSIDTISGTDLTFAKVSGYNVSYKKTDLKTAADTLFSFTESTGTTAIVKVAENKEQRKDIAKMGNFYLIHSFTFEEVNDDAPSLNDFKDLPLDNGTLDGLVAHRALTDDMLSNNSFFNAQLTAYNQRMHLFNYHMRHTIPTAPGYQNGKALITINAYSLKNVFVLIHTANGEKVVRLDNSTALSINNTSFSWFYYPHNGAYKAILVYSKTELTDAVESAGTTTTTSESIQVTGTTTYATVTLELKQHDTLNGAYWLTDNLGDMPDFIEDLTTNPADSISVNDESYYPSSVIQSPVSAPYVFQSNLMNTFGVQRITAMSSAAKALSQGQFGQFPLYAFTTEGIWALSVSDTGTYATKQPITRDVCLSRKSVTQMDSSVLYTTDRGIMLLSGSESICLSDSINTEYPFAFSQLPKADKVLSLYNNKASDKLKAELKDISLLPFNTFLKGCGMVYDYPHQHIFVYNPDVRYAYVFSMRSKAWGMILSDISANVNSYPMALAMTTDHRLVDFSQTATDKTIPALIVTRPFKLDSPDTLKTIDAIIQRGYFQKDNVMQVLYASNDLFNWQTVWSSKNKYLRGFRGTPYKAFRLAIIAGLGKDERIFGCSAQYTQRLTDQIR